jgi:hypothetical protein
MRTGLAVAAMALVAAGVAAQPSAPPSEMKPSPDARFDASLASDVRSVVDRIAALVRAKAPVSFVAMRAEAPARASAARQRADRVLPPPLAEARGRAWRDLGLGGATAPAELAEALASDLDGMGLDAAGARLLVDPDRLRGDETEGDPDADAAASLLLTTGVAPDEPVVGHYVAHTIFDDRSAAGPATTDAQLARAALSEGGANVAALLMLFGGVGLEGEVVAGKVRPEDALSGRLVPASVRSAPPPVAAFLEFAYLDGFAQASTLVKAGDFARLAMERRRRKTTRDVMHLDRQPLAPAEIPSPPPPSGTGLEPVDHDVLGEEGIVAWVSQLTGKDNLALIAGDGWAGDGLWRLERPGSPEDGVSIWISRWITEEDAKDMAYSLERCLQARFPGEALKDGTEGARVLARQDRVYRIRRTAAEVTFRVAPPAWDQKFERVPTKEIKVVPSRPKPAQPKKL